jgi:hypothetical protein
MFLALHEAPTSNSATQLQKEQSEEHTDASTIL